MTGPEEEAAGRPRAWRWGWWAVLTLIVGYAFARLDAAAILGVLRTTHPGWFAAGAGANLAIVWLWSEQWRIFLPRSRRPSSGRMFRVTAIMSSISNGGPALAGHLTGGHLLATRTGMGYPAALSVVALDQLCEGVAKVALLALVAALAPLPGPLRAAAGALAVGVGALAALLWVAAWLSARRRDRGQGERGASADAAPSGGWGTPNRLRASWLRLRRLLARAAGHLEDARHPRVWGGGIALALAMKAAELGGVVAAQHALGVEVGMTASLLVLASVSIATMVPVAPANLGPYEAAAFGAYVWVGVDPATATALALVQHIAFLLPAAGTGWALVTLTRPGRAGAPAVSGEEVNRPQRREPSRTPSRVAGSPGPN